MKTIHIDQATNTQIDYAVAVAQGWILRTFMDLENTEKCLGMREMFIWTRGKEVLYSLEIYMPTTNQEQCGELIDNFKINVLFKNNLCECFIGHAKAGRDKSRLVSACKAFLWSKYPDGQIPLFQS